MSLTSAALRYAGQGWPVFPCHPGTKRPMTAHGFKDAVSVIAVVSGWWAREPRANIGLDIPEGLVILDFDPRNGAPTPWKLGLPSTQVAYTPSGGQHLYYRVPKGLRFKGQFVQGVDVKAAGRGYVLLPPSRLDESSNYYRWMSVGALIADLPNQVLLDITKDDLPQLGAGAEAYGKRKYFPWERGSGYGLGVLRRCVNDVCQAREGGRNNALNKATFEVTCFIAGGELSEAVLEDILEAAVANGLSRTEATLTMRSAYEAGLASPRSLEGS